MMLTRPLPTLPDGSARRLAAALTAGLLGVGIVLAASPVASADDGSAAGSTSRAAAQPTGTPESPPPPPQVPEPVEPGPAASTEPEPTDTASPEPVSPEPEPTDAASAPAEPAGTPSAAPEPTGPASSEPSRTGEPVADGRNGPASQLPSAEPTTAIPGDAEPAGAARAEASSPAPQALAADDPGPSDPAAGRTYTVTDAAGRQITYTVPATVQPGADIVISGTGWLVTDASKGSVFSVLLDATFSGDPNTVYTRRDVTNPVTGAVSADKRLHAIVEADSSGAWTATIPYPTSANARLADGTWTAWAAGSTHQLRLLSGTLETRTPDVVRSVNAEFAIAGEDPAGPSDPPAWAHQTVTYTDPATSRTAIAWVQREVPAGDHGSIRIKGTGWVGSAGTGASTVALKLNRGDGQQYTRTGDGIVAHPSATGDDTIWVLLAPSNPGSHPNVYPIGADGGFDIEVDAPDGLRAGQYLTVLFQSGRFGAGDVQRSVTSGFLVVGGVPYVPPDESQQVTCVPGSATPTVTIANPQVSLGELLHVTGSGWCHPAPLRGGSVIGVKLDEGAYSHLTTGLHQNRTIWAIITANPADGSFAADIRLPDGTATGPNGSTPAFPQGNHTLRLLTGSLKPGDAVRTLASAAFVVGAYRPNGPPDPVEATEDLTAATRGGVTITRSATALTVVIPGSTAGDWVYLNLFDGPVPLFPWGGTWFRADSSGRVMASLSGVTLPAGTSRLSAQSGNQGEVGKLLGWGTVTGEPATAPPSGKDPADEAGENTTGSTTGTRTVVRYLTTANVQAPTAVPDPPAARASQLSDLDDGGVTGVLDGTIVTVTVPHAREAEWVYVYLYGGAARTPIGWVRLTTGRQLTVDLGKLADGRYRIAVVAADGTLLGWTKTVLGELAAPGTPVVPQQTTAGTGQPSAAIPPVAEAPRPGEPDGNPVDPVLFGIAGAVLAAGAAVAGTLAIRRRAGAGA